MKPSTVLISCDGSPGPGVNWSIRVKFRPLMKGFSVWSWQDNALSEHSRWRKVGQSSELLTWRSICRYLNNDTDLHVFGDFFDAVEISGLKPAAIDFVKSSFVIDEDAALDYRLITQLLMGFDDGEIEKILKELGALIITHDLPSIDKHKQLHSIARSARQLGLIGQSLGSILNFLSLTDSSTLEQIEEGLEVTRSANKVSELLKVIRSEARFHEIDRKWDEVIKYLGWLSLEDRLKLLVRWLSNGVNTDIWTIIESFFGNPNQAQQLFSALNDQDPLRAIELADKVMKAGKSESMLLESGYRFAGGAMASVGRYMARRKTSIALRCQDVLDRLGIPFDGRYRIQGH